MTETVSEGDLVEMTLDESKVIGRVISLNRTCDWLVLHGISDTFSFGENHWSITVIEKAAPKIELPTTPGVYSPTQPAYQSDALNNYYLDGAGIWHELESRATVVVAVEDVLEFAPFTRLEPRADTAKAVIQRITSIWKHGPTDLAQAKLSEIANEFGVKL